MSMDELKTPATLGDMIALQAMITIETMRHATLTSAAAEATLVDMANQFLEYARHATDERARAMLQAFGEHLIKTETSGLE